MAEKPKVKPVLREHEALPGTLNAINNNIVSSLLFPYEATKKLGSFMPGLPSYEMGSDTEYLKNKYLRGKGGLSVLTDDRMKPATGVTRTLEDMAGVAAGSLALGGLLRAPMIANAAAARAPGAITGMQYTPTSGLTQVARRALGMTPLPSVTSKAAYATPGVREAGRQMALYDVGVPVFAESMASPLEQKGRVGEAAALRVLGPLGGALIPSGANSAAEYALRAMKRKGYKPNELQFTEGVNLPTISMRQPASTDISDQIKDLSRRAKDFETAKGTQLGARNLDDLRRTNPATIRELVPEAQDTAALQGAAKQAAAQQGSRVASAVERPRDTATDKLVEKTVGWIDTYFNKRNAEYSKVKGDFPTVSAEPFRDAMTDVEDAVTANAMVRNVLSKVRDQNRRELSAVKDKNAAIAEARRENLNLGGLGKPVSPVGDITLPDQISPTELMQIDKELAELWRSASTTMSEKFLISKLRNGVSDTLEQSPELAAAYRNAKDVNKELMGLTRAEKGNTSSFLSALRDRNPEMAMRTNMRQILAGEKGEADGARLAKLAENAGEKDQLPKLVMDAIEDQASQAFYKSVAFNPDPKKIADSATSATSMFAKTADFRNAVGVPEADAQRAAQRVYEVVDRVKPQLEMFSEMQTNPTKVFQMAVSSNPDEAARANAILGDLSQLNPSVANNISAGVQDAFYNQFGTGTGFAHGKAAEALGRTHPSMQWLDPDVAERVQRASAAQDELAQQLRQAGVGENLAFKAGDADVSNAAAVAAMSAGQSPWPARYATKFAEWIGKAAVNRPEKMNLIGEYLTNPQAFLSAAGSNPLAYQRGIAQRLGPSVISAPYQATKDDNSVEMFRNNPEVNPPVQPETTPKYEFVDEFVPETAVSEPKSSVKYEFVEE